MAKIGNIERVPLRAVDGSCSKCGCVVWEHYFGEPYIVCRQCRTTHLIGTEVEDNNMKKRYSVIVGNLGCVHNGYSKQEGEKLYKEYVAQSKARSGRAKGEAVTLFEDGEPIKEHQGYQHVFEGNDTGTVDMVVSNRRKYDPYHCPMCQTIVLGSEVTSVQTVEPPDEGCEKVMLGRRCGGCGFSWYDEYRIEGARLPKAGEA